MCGEPPFTGASLAEVVQQHENGGVTPIVDRRPDVDVAWDGFIVQRCLAKAPEDRPSSMAELLSELPE